MADPQYIRELGNAAALSGSHYGIVDQGGDAKRSLLSALQTFYRGTDLAVIAGLTPSNDDVLQRKAGAWANRTIAQLRADIMADGQLAFPAAQNASADPNTLDDYEEGTWTPAVNYSTTQPTGLTYGQQTGRYVKIGILVFIKFGLILTNKGTGAVGNFRVSGAPFSNIDEACQLPPLFNDITLTAGYTTMTLQIESGGPLITPFQMGSGQIPLAIISSALANGSYIFGSGSYIH